MKVVCILFLYYCSYIFQHKVLLITPLLIRSFDYVIQLDKIGQEMVGANTKGQESPYIKVIVGSLAKLCGILTMETSNTKKDHEVGGSV